MSRPYLTIPTLAVLSGIVLTACGSGGSANDNAPSYVPSTDTHPCLSVEVTAPSTVKLDVAVMIRVEVKNRCEEAVTYTSSVPPYSLKLVSSEGKIVWFTPSEPIPSIPGEYAVAANGGASYDIPVRLAAGDVRPSTYRIVADLFVAQETDTTQYVEDLRLESGPQTVIIGP